MALSPARPPALLQALFPTRCWPPPHSTLYLHRKQAAARGHSGKFWRTPANLLQRIMQVGASFTDREDSFESAKA